MFRRLTKLSRGVFQALAIVKLSCTKKMQGQLALRAKQFYNQLIKKGLIRVQFDVGMEYVTKKGIYSNP